VSITRLAEGCQSPRVAPGRVARRGGVARALSDNAGQGELRSYALARHDMAGQPKDPAGREFAVPHRGRPKRRRTRPSSSLALPAGACRFPPLSSTGSMRLSLARSYNGYGLTWFWTWRPEDSPQTGQRRPVPARRLRCAWHRTRLQETGRKSNGPATRALPQPSPPPLTAEDVAQAPPEHQARPQTTADSGHFRAATHQMHHVYRADLRFYEQSRTDSACHYGVRRSARRAG
jgi:hypothetical protein